MPTLSAESASIAEPKTARAVLEVTVRNHPGVMSHVCGLFARRGFNVEAILCLPLGSGQESRIWLLVTDDARLEQMLRQLRKLQDVLDVRRHGAGHEVFLELERLFREEHRPAANSG